MNVIRASVLGYCAGVRRAVDIALHEAASASHKVYTVGPLIHNPAVLERLKSRGVMVSEEESEADTAVTPVRQDDVAIIRAHGITPKSEERLRERGFRITDATCPKVKKNQMLAKELAETGYRVFLAGEKLHEEIIGIQGYAPGSIVVEDAIQAMQSARALYAEQPAVKTALIAQTTISIDDYTAISETLQTVFPAIMICNTICSATRERQDAIRSLCKKADAVIIAGGRNSANTRHLLAVAESVCAAAYAASGVCKPVILVEHAREIPSSFLEGTVYKTIGISAGASTPDDIIDEVERTLRGCRRLPGSRRRARPRQPADSTRQGDPRNAHPK
ncbi:MAG: 4-hydroxy-3-methylbut-2-enyl diphosphate reductase [Treponema sp.]|nr:4-hydroxy-3-methylbut-2-enyl diphosphate reductase [Treponema sp.]